jgi:hypothetical protein
MEEKDVKQIMQDHRDILKQEIYQNRQYGEYRREEMPEVETQVRVEDYEDQEVEPVKPRRKKKKEMNNEDMVKKLYFQKYGGKGECFITLKKIITKNLINRE